VDRCLNQRPIGFEIDGFEWERYHTQNITRYASTYCAMAFVSNNVHSPAPRETITTP